MIRYLTKIFSCTIILFISVQVSAQQISNVNARLAGEDVIINYDLVGAAVGQKFRIEVYSSHDNFTAPLQQVEGNVGEDQLGGSGKQITWHAKRELGVYSGPLTFEVRSTVTFNPIQITNPNASSSFKPGQNMSINWRGGMQPTTMQLELLKGNTLNRSIGSTSNTGTYRWDVPKDLEKGTDYQVKLYDIANPSTETISSNFVIKSKGGAGKILIPVAAAGATAGVLCVVKVICPDNTETQPPVIENTDLPSPPDPSGSVGAARFQTGLPLLRIILGN